jgi:hypothetical protein
MQIKKIIGLSEWLTFTLADNSIFDPPAIRLRLRYMNPFAGADAEDVSKNSSVMKAAMFDAIADWDLQDETGKPVPCNEDMKGPGSRLRLTLEALLGSALADSTPTDPKLLGTAILQYSQNRENFLGN